MSTFPRAEDGRHYTCVDHGVGDCPECAPWQDAAHVARMSIFGPEAVETVAIRRFSREMCGHHADGGRRGGRARWAAANDLVRASWLQSAAEDIAAAEAALDREALIERIRLGPPADYPTQAIEDAAVEAFLTTWTPGEFDDDGRYGLRADITAVLRISYGLNAPTVIAALFPEGEATDGK